MTATNITITQTTFPHGEQTSQVDIKVSVILPCLNSSRTIGVQLEALATQSWDQSWELIVSDNGSTDGTQDLVKGYKQKIRNLRIVDSSARRGASYGRNVGAQAATGESLLFCDADDEVAPGWLSSMGEALSQHDVVVCQRERNKLNPDWAVKARGNPPTNNGLRLLPRIWFPPYLQTAGVGTMGVKRSLHESIGGFDEALLNQEDTDYCIRLQLHGAKLHFVPDAVIHMRYRSSTMGFFNQAYSYSYWDVVLSKKYQVMEKKPTNFRQRHIKGWRRFLRAMPRSYNKAGRTKLMWILGWQLGGLSGSFHSYTAQESRLRATALRE